RSRIDSYGSSAELRETRREVGGAAAELDDVEAGDVPEGVQLALGMAEDAPGQLVLPPGPQRAAVRVLGVLSRPDLSVARGGVDRLRQGRMGRRAPAHAARSPSSPSRGRCSAKAR